MKKITYPIIFFGVLWILTGCHDDTLNNPLRDFEAPVIQLIDPDSTTLILSIGEQIEFSLEASDDLQLSFFRVFLSVQDPEGAELLPFTLLTERSLSERFERLSFTDVIDSFPSFSKLKYLFVVEDQRQASDSASVVITAVIEDPTSSPLYPVATYGLQTLWSGASDRFSAYNFTTQQGYLSTHNNPLELDIQELSTGSEFLAQLRSPNNERLDRDSIFVLLDSTKLNYAEADYEKIWGAYQSSTEQVDLTPRLKRGDLVIIRLTKAPSPQFALMQIGLVQDLSGSENDFIEFEYKVSSR
ncbi:MAG: hypothetical protein AAF694_01240 [Bacteroidota bacterium]